MTPERERVRKRIWSAIQGAVAVTIALPLILGLWAPRWFSVAWVATYVVAAATYVSVRLRSDDPRVEFSWYITVSCLFAGVPLSTLAFEPPTHAVFAAVALSTLHLANEISIRDHLTVGDWRIGPAIVTTGTCIGVAANVGWVLAVVLLGTGAMIIANAQSQRLAEGEIRYERDHDELTSLLNRRGFLDAIADHADRQVTVVMVDADRFKMINDTYGHASGDDVLVAIAGALGDRLGPTWRIARQGGDEFAAYAPGRVHVPEETVAPVTCEIPWRDDTIEIDVRLSAGVAYSEAGDPDRLLSRAGYALKASKRNGGGVSVFDPELEQQFTRALAVTATSGADADEALFAVAQRIGTADAVHGWELLARWRGPDGSVLSPASVLPLLSENGLMPQLNDQMLELGVRFAARFNGHDDAPFVSVNITASHLANPSLVTHVAELLDTHHLDPSRLMIEITEGEGLDALASWQNTARDLVGLGVKLAIDDFGSGYSNIERIHQLPITHLKFDRAFAISVDGPLGEVVRGVVRFAKASGLGIIAEGIETVEERDAMRDAGVSAFQGYLFGRPCALEQVEREWTAVRRGRLARARTDRRDASLPTGVAQERQSAAEPPVIRG